MKVDFVIPWVDDRDKNWIIEKNKYSGEQDGPIDATDARYRDWDILKYWFRGVEKYAPWVNKVYFVTCGQTPEWMNVDNKKLVLVNHKDYMPEKYLPTFSANPIELNFHRIKDLSQHFVYFNDDMFLTSEVSQKDFFKNGLPCDMAVEDPLTPNVRHVFNDILVNDLILLNERFDRREVLKKNWKKFYLVKDKRAFMMNWSFFLWRRHDFFGLEYSHLPAPYLKSVFEQVWSENEQLLDEVCQNKFRSINDVNQYIFKNYQIATGQFEPYNWRKVGKAFYLNDTDTANNNIKETCEAVATGKYKMICLNETEVTHFEESKKAVQMAFERLLPDKSSFEK